MEHNLRFAPDILARLGEELTPHPDLGIMELVRNAYDADARVCRVELRDAKQPGGCLTIVDNGLGMTDRDLASDFLLIGKSSKPARPVTFDGRRKVGEKGLGRLAALRLGTHVVIASRPKSQPGREYRLTIDWERFAEVDAVEDVPLRISAHKTDETQGTTIRISGMRQGMSSDDIERFSRALLLLTGPFGEGSKFEVMCDAPEFDRVADTLSAELTAWYEYRLVATLGENGRMAATLYNWRDEPEFVGDHDEVAQNRTQASSDIPSRFYAPPSRFELFMFNLNPSKEKQQEPRFADQDRSRLRSWLREVGGVHFYHRGLRVQPYGDPDNDWLSINRRRVASPEMRPSSNNSVGRMQVDDTDNVLRPKTDRSGFADTSEFMQLKEFAVRALDWAAHKRLSQREQRRVAERPKARKKREKSERTYQDYKKHRDKRGNEDPKEQLFPIDRDGEKLADAVIETQREEIQVLREDLLLYRSLATVGTTTAVFAHEAIRPASRIINEVKVIQVLLGRQLGDAANLRDLNESLLAAKNSAETLKGFSRLPPSLLRKSKRTITEVNIDRSCEDVVELFSRYLQQRNIVVKFDLDAPDATVRTTIADIESILSNLLVNAAHAFTETDAPACDRIVRVRTQLSESGNQPQVMICVDDSGPGIRGLSLEAIWLPGRTTRQDGTGLGLTIVRDIVADLGGTQEARGNSELGGARIMVWLPVSQTADTPQGKEALCAH